VSLDETVEENDLNDLLAVFGCNLPVVSNWIPGMLSR